MKDWITSENLAVAFKLLDWVRAGLDDGQLVRTGGVVQHAPGRPLGGQVAAWLREVSARPMPPDRLVPAPSRLADTLGFAGSAPSVLSLGATVAFAPEALVALAAVDALLGDISGKIDRLQWTVDVGFYTALQALSRIEGWLKMEVIADLRVGAEQAWTAQLLEPASSQRETRLEKALEKVLTGAEKLVQDTERRLADQATRFAENRMPWRVVDRLDSTLEALEQFRTTMRALDLKLMLYAETNTPVQASESVKAASESLRAGLMKLMQSFLRGDPGQSDSLATYQILLNGRWAESITASRVNRWARRFDPAFSGGLCAVVDQLRVMPGTKRYHYGYSFPGWNQATSDNLRAFADQLDGAWEDLDRLSGHIAEMRSVPELASSLYGYRDALRVPACPQDLEHKIAFFCRPQDA